MYITDVYEAYCTYVDDKYFDNHDYDDDTDADTDNDTGYDTDDDTSRPHECGESGVCVYRF